MQRALGDALAPRLHGTTQLGGSGVEAAQSDPVPHAASAAPENACCASEPVPAACAHRAAAIRSARCFGEKLGGDRRTRGRSRLCSTAVSHVLSVVQLCGSKLCWAAQIRCRVWPTVSLSKPYKQKERPIADAE